QLLLWCLLLLGGCRAPRLETVDQSVANFACLSFDLAPAPAPAAQSPRTPTGSRDAAPSPRLSANVIPAACSQVGAAAPGQVPPTLQKFQLEIPKEVPGSEAPLIKLPAEPTERRKIVGRLYPEPRPLPEEPKALPGPNGRPYMLADLQQLAAANSPALRQ